STRSNSRRIGVRIVWRGCVTMRHVESGVRLLSMTVDKRLTTANKLNHARVRLRPLRADKSPVLVLEILRLVVSGSRLHEIIGGDGMISLPNCLRVLLP